MNAIEKNKVKEAIDILESYVLDKKYSITNASSAMDYMRLRIAHKHHEVFAVMFLSTNHTVIEIEEMFIGTIDSCSVYPRDIAKRALELNAKAVILSHNHPSGSLVPSEADKSITNHIKSCLALFDIRVLDHIIVTRTDAFSFAEKGLM